MIILQYALLGDLHSHYKNTKAVLQHIKEIHPNAEIIGLGDLFECIIGKRKAESIRGAKLHEAAKLSDKFLQLLTFSSVIGNQEERIAMVTGLQQFLNYEGQIVIDGATIMHGHQFLWDEHFEPTFPEVHTPLLFFGHSHRAAIYIDGVRTAIRYNEEIYVGDRSYAINVGAVVESRDWCLYDSEKMSVTFYQA
ncbi:metallophosphoesterase family protein [Lysinibacillus sp. 54212]|uniref:metallophosphoesterase family protein n=1 Tax=Lysinibacillus sp. 54212 TaxID=3119829 RepID=UPI002FCC79C7